MADTKISNLPEATILTDDDVFVVVDAPGGTPATKRISKLNVEGSLDHTKIANIGTKTHTEIDSHVNSTSNPHSVDETDILPSQTGNNGKVLQTDGTNTSWEAGGAGAGDVTGPATAVDENIAVFNSTTGKIIKDGLINKSAITANTAKISFDSTSSTKLGTIEESADVTDEANVSATASVIANTAKVGITPTQASNITTNNAKVSYSTAASDAVALNTAKETNVDTNITVVEAPTNVDIQSSDGTNDVIEGANSTNAGVMTKALYDEHVINTAKDGITSGQASAITANSAFTSTPSTVITAGTNISWDGNTLNAAAGGSSPLTTKGDLSGYDTVDARIPIGTNGQVLTADSTEGLGVKWDTPASGVTDHTLLSNIGTKTHATLDSEVGANNSKISFDSTSSTKLGTIEESAEVNNISDANATDLTDGGDTTLHDHAGISENTSARHNAVTVTDTAEIDMTLTGQDIKADIKTGSVDVLKLDSGVQTSLGKADSALQSFTEADPVYLASQAANIDAGDITNLSNLSGSNSGDNAGVTSVSGGTGLTSTGGTTPSLSHNNHTGNVTGSTVLSIASGVVTETHLNTSVNTSLNLADASLQDADIDVNVQSYDATTAAFKKSNSSFTDNDTAQTFTDAFCTADSLVVVSISSATQPQGYWIVDSAAGSFTITSDTAETADITFDYYIHKTV